MKSVGNDIIALSAIDKERSNRQQFYSKILSVSEQQLFKEQIFRELPFEHFVWLLWSIKESVYKCLKRSVNDLIFSPTKIVVQQIDLSPGAETITFEGTQLENKGFDDAFYKGVIFFDNRALYFRSKIFTELITTVVAEDDNFDNIFWGVQKIEQTDYAHQSAAVRAFVLSRLKVLIPDNDLTIEKTPVGYPVILQARERLDIAVSLAHHEQFVAYALVGSVPLRPNML